MAFTQRLPANTPTVAHFTLSLTAEERTRSHHHFHTDEGQGIHLQLPRGTVLYHGDLLTTEAGEWVVRIVAKPEPVITATAHTPLELLRAAYHLGNRHVPLEVQVDYLRLSTDPVLKLMLIQIGLQVTEATLPFQPEAGAYQERAGSQHHSHSHDPAHHHLS
ncbi:MAG TPA: urease accessory protein UreE [Coleofasciculaceae cyanobacterium]|jgi:urease accessory protein